MTEKKENFVNISLRRIRVLYGFLLSGTKLMISKPFWKNRIVRRVLVAGALINISIWLFLLKNRQSDSYPITLHYNLSIGPDYLDMYSKIYLIPFVGVIVILLNSIIGFSIYGKEKLASYFLIFNILLVQALLFLAAYSIISVNS